MKLGLICILMMVGCAGNQKLTPEDEKNLTLYQSQLLHCEERARAADAGEHKRVYLDCIKAEGL